MGLFSKRDGNEWGNRINGSRVDRKSLKPGDHIYSWRTAYIYAHHGIYVGDDKVIHFTSWGQEVGIGTVPDLPVASTVPARNEVCCSTCKPLKKGHHGVISTCLSCFLAGGDLYRFEYSVSLLFFHISRGGTCNPAASDPDDIVVHRANYLLNNNGFGRYNFFKNNCEDFAFYCKTGLLVVDKNILGQSGQAVSAVCSLVTSGRLASLLFRAALCPRSKDTTKDVFEALNDVFDTLKVHCEFRSNHDTGTRKDSIKVSPEDLTKMIAAGAL